MFTIRPYRYTMLLRSRASSPPSKRIRSKRVQCSARKPAYTIAAAIAPMIPPQRAAARSTPAPPHRFPPRASLAVPPGRPPAGEILPERCALSVALSTPPVARVACHGPATAPSRGCPGRPRRPGRRPRPRRSGRRSGGRPRRGRRGGRGCRAASRAPPPAPPGPAAAPAGPPGRRERRLQPQEGPDQVDEALAGLEAADEQHGGVAVAVAGQGLGLGEELAADAVRDDHHRAAEPALP